MKEVIRFLAQRRKAVQSFIGAELVWFATSYLPDQHVNAYEWYAQALVIAAALGVHQVANDATPPASDSTPANQESASA